VFNRDIFGTVSPMDATPSSPASNGSATPPFGSPSGSPGSPNSPLGPDSPWRPGHGRKQSLGTTKTSPSTRRRSLESTISLIKEVVDGKDAGGESMEITEIADQLSSPSRHRVRFVGLVATLPLAPSLTT
jgi:serine/threonine-protein phosphatase 2B catalytic subunit